MVPKYNRAPNAIPCLSLLVAILFAGPCGHSQSNYRFQHFDPPDGVPAPLAYSILQDSLGFLWFHYTGGLVRYDGYNFKLYKYNPSDSTRSPGKSFDGRMLVDRSGNIWTQNQQVNTLDRTLILSKYDPTIDGFIKYNLNLEGASVEDVCFDKSSSLVWLGTEHPGKGLRSFNPSTGEIKKYLNLPPGAPDNFTQGPDEPRNKIAEICDLDSFLLLATWDGLWKFDKATEKFMRPECNPADSNLLFHQPILNMIERGDIRGNRIWLIVDKGMTILDKNLVVTHRIEFPKEFPVFKLGDFDLIYFQAMDVDKNGVVWMALLGNGLFRYNPEDKTFINLESTSGDPYSLKTDLVNGVMVDRDQNVWVATRDKWISQLRKQSLNFYYFNTDNLSDATSYRRNEKDYLLVAKNVSGKQTNSEILIAEISPQNLGATNFQRVEINSTFKGNVNYLSVGKRNLWMGTGDEGVAGLPMDPESGQIASGPIRTFRHDPKIPYTITSDGTSGVWEDGDENVWVGTYGRGLSRVFTKMAYGSEGSVTRFVHSAEDTNSISHNVIWWDFYPPDNESFFVRTAAGIDRFRNNQFEHVLKDEFAVSINKTAGGKLFFGVFGAKQGLYESVRVGDRYRVNAIPFRSDGSIILEDKKGLMWIMSLNLSCYDPKNKSSIRFSEKDGASMPKRAFQTTNGVIAMTDDHGITLFDPLSLKVDEKKIKPVITALTVNNKPVQVQSDSDVGDEFSISTHISLLKELTLDYKHNNFTAEFSAMQLTAPEKNLYRHKLEGYDPDWIETDYNNRTATYTNLDAGNYTFIVKASNHHGLWSDQERTLSVTILPPPWKTWWAYTGYLIMLSAALALGRRNIIQRERLKATLKLEHMQLEKAKEVDRVKSAFFANISHEFRTPLTLIKGPVQELLEEFTDHPKVKDRLKLVQRNADLVLKLINQLLDLAKLESGTLSIEKSESDLNAFLSVVTNSFSSLAFQKNITLKTLLPEMRQVVSFDKGKVETILINLINNAIKFTPTGGSVVVRTELVSLQANNDTPSAGTPLWRRGGGGEVELVLIVSDTGIGIDIDQHEKIFERFHQVSEAHNEVGTGIGLSLVKELVALMNGTLSLISEPGKGSEFKVIIPVEVIRLLTEEEAVEQIEEEHELQEYTLKENGNESHDNKPRILVVEDNSDLRKFIIGSLGGEFHFLEGADGKQGLETALGETPDLIISDVMMPEMDGITMTGKLKNDTRTSHIPIILLTAKTSDESKLSGLETGADDYLTKPFNKNELLLKVRNSIALRVKLREKLKLELLKESPNVEVQSADEKFLLKVRDAILARLSDEQLSVESLADEIGLSRSQLFRKISALTGASVNELIRTFRLQRAAQLIEQNWGPVTQVAYEVGFSNLSYFSKAFKEKYGVLPSEYPIKTQ